MRAAGELERQWQIPAERIVRFSAVSGDGKEEVLNWIGSLVA
jgi:hypothetical protein